ncbi:glycosyl hydrolase family 92 [Colletotrichum tabaci]|uniref:Glycosyl hydrolase family 92 n=1 Tax=Colletotrichum tabaci TaxID=1209068 RepID=A0AAV9T1H2_9PEZI
MTVVPQCWLGGLHDKYMAPGQICGNRIKSLWINGTDTNFPGVFLQKYMNGTWGLQDPIARSNLAGFCSLASSPSETIVASIWQHQIDVPHSTATLIGWPVFLTSYLYHNARRPPETLGGADPHVYTFVFNATRRRAAGNDNSGAIGAFVAFLLTDVFPVAGQESYFVTPPFFGESARLYGEAYSRGWIGYGFLNQGRMLELVWFWG